MCRVLKPGGRLVILEFHIRGPAGWLFYWFERLLLDRSEFLSPDRLQGLLDRQGLSGATQRISRLQYLYVGQKPGGGVLR
jgi:ubiquinone/menaquinone biosynthesis C-methylase UbiE